MSSADLSPPMNQVFLDFENVHHIDLSIVGSRSVSFTLLLGANQSKLDAAVVEKLMRHAASVQLVRLTTSGRNALDFGKGLTEADVASLIEKLAEAGHISLTEKGAVDYHLDP